MEGFGAFHVDRPKKPANVMITMGEFCMVHDVEKNEIHKVDSFLLCFKVDWAKVSKAIAALVVI